MPAREETEKKRLRLLALIEENPEGDVYWASLWVQPGNSVSFKALCMVQHSDGFMSMLCGI